MCIHVQLILNFVLFNRYNLCCLGMKKMKDLKPTHGSYPSLKYIGNTILMEAMSLQIKSKILTHHDLLI